MEFTCDKLANENKMLKKHIINLENNSRRNNVVIRGISENSSESNVECGEKTRKFMINELKLDDDRVKKVNFIRVHRMGGFQKNVQHSMIVDQLSFDSRTMLTNQQYGRHEIKLVIVHFLKVKNSPQRLNSTGNIYILSINMQSLWKSTK